MAKIMGEPSNVYPVDDWDDQDDEVAVCEHEWIGVLNNNSYMTCAVCGLHKLKATGSVPQVSKPETCEQALLDLPEEQEINGRKHPIVFVNGIYQVKPEPKKDVGMVSYKIHYTSLVAPSKKYPILKMKPMSDLAMKVPWHGYKGKK